MNQVAFPIHANLPVLSAPENAWNAGKAFAFSGCPSAVHNGLICLLPETIEIEVFFGKITIGYDQEEDISIRRKECHFCIP